MPIKKIQTPHTNWVDKQPGSSINWRSLSMITIILIIWLWLCHALRNTNHYYISTLITGGAFLAIAPFVMNLLTPELTQKLKWVLVGVLLLKIILSVVYFNHFFVIRENGVVTIAPYGDSIQHHQAAVEFLGRWERYGAELGLDPSSPSGYLPSHVTSIGYSGLLALIYADVGVVPEIGIVINSFLAFVFCLLSYRLFSIAGLPSRIALMGLVLLIFCPALWLWSSLLYKESLLFLVTTICALAAIKVITKFTWSSLLIVIASLSLLLTLRFPFVLPLLALLVFGSFYLYQKEIKKKLFFFISGCVVVLALLGVQENFNLINSTTSIGETVKTVINLKPSGGSFMTNGIGSIPPDITNFWYTLPARAIYILMIPMPWFGGDSPVERFDYLVSHLDAVYDITLFAALFLMVLQGSYFAATKVQNVLLIVGLMYFAIPLFFFFPSRRYFTIAIPFLLVYVLPFLTQKKGAATSMGLMVIFISAVQFAYYIKYS